jgi:hypothetical protein
LLGLLSCCCVKTSSTKKLAQSVDMNYGLNLAVLEVVRVMEGLGKNGQGMFWSSSSIKEVHRAVEEVMMKEMDFTIITARHNDIWIDGVEIDVKKLLIYLVNRYGLSKKARTVGIEVTITVDSAKLDEYCYHTTSVWKFTNISNGDPLIVNNTDPDNRLMLRIETIQSERCCFPIITMIAKDNKMTYDKLLRYIFVFCQEIRENGIHELGWLPFRVAKPQDTKSIQLCMVRGCVAKQIPYFCHLCQKHSDDLVRPNQVKYHECCSNGNNNCFCYPITDAKEIASVQRRKAALDTKEDSERMTFLCEQLYGGTGTNTTEHATYIW